MPNSIRYYFFMSLAILGWGMSTIFIEFGLEHLSPFSFLFYRFFIAFLLMSPFMVKNIGEIIKLLKNRWIWIIGISESAGLLFQYLGQNMEISAALSALLSLIFLIIVPFLSPLVLDDRVTKFHIIAIFLGIVGVFFIATQGEIATLFSGSILGIFLLLLSAFSYAVYIVTTSRYNTRENPSINPFIQFYVVLVIINLVSFTTMVSLDGIVIPNRSVWLWLGLLVVFSTLLAFICYFEALKGISANTASVLLLFQILVPFSVEYILGLRYKIWTWVGVILITFAMLVVVIGDGKKE
ncbi:MAG: DMT family transporter [Candidatus Heimdallarchaeota archaeon]|nr:DMT family transporter [Candidatus Heimdallarchaeota archaeon]